MESKRLCCENSNIDNPQLIPKEVPQLNSFPDSVLILIYSFLPYDTLLCSVRLVCKRWFQLCRDVDIWKHRRIITLSSDTSMRRMTDASLLDFFQYAPNIMGMDLTYCYDVTGAGLCKAIVHTKNLQELLLCSINHANPEVLEVITSHCTQLRDISFRNCLTDGLKSADIAKLSRCAELRSFSGYQYQNLDEPAMLTILEGCRKLQKVNFKNNRRYMASKPIVEAIARNELQLTEVVFDFPWGLPKIDKTTAIPSLKQLTIESADECLDDDCLRKLADCCPNLTYLLIGNINLLGKTGFSYLLNRLKNLETLHLYPGEDGSFDDDYIKIIAENCCQLKELILFIFEGMSESGLHYLRPLLGRNLKQLQIAEDLLDDGADVFPNLQEEFPDAEIECITIHN